MNWITVDAKGEPLELSNLFDCLASSNAGCFIESLRKNRGKKTYSIRILLKPEYDAKHDNHADALDELRQLVKQHLIYSDRLLTRGR